MVGDCECRLEARVNRNAAVEHARPGGFCADLPGAVMSGFLAELKRRRVVRVALVYAATAFVVLQAADLLAAGEVQRLDRARGDDASFWTFWARFLLVVSATVLFLALAGIYSVMAFTVARGTREIGIRVALGAAASRVVAETFRKPLRLDRDVGRDRSRPRSVPHGADSRSSRPRRCARSRERVVDRVRSFYLNGTRTATIAR